MPELKFSLLAVLSGLLLACPYASQAQGLGLEQAQEKSELSKMREELNDLKSTIKEGMDSFSQYCGNEGIPPLQEFKLIAKAGKIEITPGTFVNAATYNGLSPGPVIKVKQGDFVSLLIQNQLSTPTSFYIDGLILPQRVSGLPKEGAGIIKPGANYLIRFTPEEAGTFCYHPQINHLAQKSQGLYGALIVEPKAGSKVYSKERVLVIGQWKTEPANQTYFTVNGKCAPNIPAIEVEQGDRVRLRVINTATQPVPLHLTGHRFEVVATNGNDATEPHVYRDTVYLNPADRMDLEFLANNPGTWALSSQLPAQASNNGKFPGGIAIVVRYKN